MQYTFRAIQKIQYTIQTVWGKKAWKKNYWILQWKTCMYVTGNRQTWYFLKPYLDAWALNFTGKRHHDHTDWLMAPQKYILKIAFLKFMLLVLFYIIRIHGFFLMAVNGKRFFTCIMVLLWHLPAESCWWN